MNQSARYLQQIINHFNGKLAAHKLPFIELCPTASFQRNKESERLHYIHDYHLPPESSPTRVSISFSVIYDVSKLLEDGRRMKVKRLDDLDRYPRFLSSLFNEPILRGELDVYQDGVNGAVISMSFGANQQTFCQVGPPTEELVEVFQERLEQTNFYRDVRNAIDLAFDMYSFHGKNTRCRKKIGTGTKSIAAHKCGKSVP